MWTEGVLIGLYEPVYLMFKSAVHAVYPLNPSHCRKLGLCLHLANTVSAFFLSQFFLRAWQQQQQQQHARRNVGRDAELTNMASTGACALAALIFGLHPLRAEVVGWPSAMPYLLTGKTHLPLHSVKNTHEI